MMWKASVTVPDPGGKTRCSERLWIFDFDGTLSPIVPDRQAAALEPSCRQLLLELSAAEGQQVAVVSSRTLDDLIPRVGITGISLGGSNGLEWLYPENKRCFYGEIFKKDVITARETILPKLLSLHRIPGLDIEDKYWTLALHLRNVAASKKSGVAEALKKLAILSEALLLEGPEAYEIILSPLADKSMGVLILCQHIGPGRDRQIVYAGDDENDLRAMKTILAMGGSVITVSRIRLPGSSHHANSPRELAQICRKIFADEKN